MRSASSDDGWTDLSGLKQVNLKQIKKNLNLSFNLSSSDLRLEEDDSMARSMSSAVFGLRSRDVKLDDSELFLRRPRKLDGLGRPRLVGFFP